jgi:arabinan endo-1,5-alpha-L-arabinosidase
MPEWALAIVPQATNIWAPDASLVDGVWHVYYAVSSFGSPVSVIGLVTTPSLASPVWTDRGLVIRSDKADNFNAIDPTLVEDTSTTPPSYWLVFGSFWSGIKAVRIDAATGKVGGDNTTVVSLAQRAPPDALEGAFMVVRPDAHYLFASWTTAARAPCPTTAFTLVAPRTAFRDLTLTATAWPCSRVVARCFSVVATAGLVAGARGF